MPAQVKVAEKKDIFTITQVCVILKVFIMTCWYRFILLCPRTQICQWSILTSVVCHVLCLQTVSQELVFSLTIVSSLTLSFIFTEALSSGEPKPIISNVARNIGNYWLRVTTWYIHCNFVARQATLSVIACQPTLALVAETKLRVYNECCIMCCVSTLVFSFRLIWLCQCCIYHALYL